MAPNRERPTDGLTPVPMLFLDDLKTVLKSVDKNVQKTHQEIVRIQEQTKAADKRIADLEAQTDEIIANPHDCKRKDSIHAIEKETKDLSTKHATLETALKSANSEIDEVKTQKNQATYWLLGIIVLVISGAIGWIVTLTTLKTEVNYIKEQQDDLKANLSIVQQRIINETTKTRQAIETQTANVTKELERTRLPRPIPPTNELRAAAKTRTPPIVGQPPPTIVSE